MTKRQYIRARRILKRRMKIWMRRVLPKAVLPGFLIFGLIVGILLGNRAAAFAKSRSLNDYGRQKFYAEYTVQKGDTIWSIASDLSALNPEYNDIRQYVKAIQNLNSMKGTTIRTGDTLLIPYFVNMDGSIDYNEIYEQYGIKGAAE